MYHNYLAPVVLLFVSIIVFRFVFKRFTASRGKVEGFEEKKESIPTPNDQGVRLLYEIRGMMLNHQNDIDKQIQLLSEKKDSSIVLDKMSELENLLKGKTTMNIDPSDSANTEESESESESEHEEPEPEPEPEKKPKKSKKVLVKTQPVDDDSSDDESNVVESFVDGIEYNNSATNCYEVN